jgi:hypothetical protein
MGARRHAGRAEPGSGRTTTKPVTGRAARAARDRHDFRQVALHADFFYNCSTTCVEGCVGEQTG